MKVIIATMLLLAMSSLAFAGNETEKKVLQVEIPQKYLDLSMEKEITLMFKYQFFAFQKAGVCNGTLETSITWNNRDTFTLGEMKVSPSRYEMGCNTEARDHHISILEVNNRYGRPETSLDVINMQDIVTIKNGQAETLLRKFVVPADVKIEVEIYEMEKKPTIYLK